MPDSPAPVELDLDALERTARGQDLGRVSNETVLALIAAARRAKALEGVCICPEGHPVRGEQISYTGDSAEPVCAVCTLEAAARDRNALEKSIEDARKDAQDWEAEAKEHLAKRTAAESELASLREEVARLQAQLRGEHVDGPCVLCNQEPVGNLPKAVRVDYEDYRVVDYVEQFDSYDDAVAAAQDRDGDDRLEAERERDLLRKALREAVRFVGKGAIDCAGSKCRLPNCVACFGEDPVLPDWDLLDAALASSPEGTPSADCTCSGGTTDKFCPVHWTEGPLAPEGTGEAPAPPSGEVLEAGRKLTKFLTRAGQAPVAMQWARHAVDLVQAGGDPEGPTIRFPDGWRVRFNLDVWRETSAAPTSEEGSSE